MAEAWDRLTPERIRQMLKEFLRHPAELVTFQRLARHIASDADVLHPIAEQRPDLFVITSSDRFVKLFPEAVERILGHGIEQTLAEVRLPRSGATAVRDHYPS